MWLQRWQCVWYGLWKRALFRLHLSYLEWLHLGWSSLTHSYWILTYLTLLVCAPNTHVQVISGGVISLAECDLAVLNHWQLCSPKPWGFSGKSVSPCWWWERISDCSQLLLYGGLMTASNSPRLSFEMIYSMKCVLARNL